MDVSNILSSLGNTKYSSHPYLSDRSTHFSPHSQDGNDLEDSNYILDAGYLTVTNTTPIDVDLYQWVTLTPVYHYHNSLASSVKTLMNA